METSEFDLHADSYYEQHSKNIALSGEAPEFFAEYKVVDAKRLAVASPSPVSRILDFGSGIGNSIPHFRMYFPRSEVVCADTSRRSLEVAAQRFPGRERGLLVNEDAALGVPDGYFDLCFSACVFHHISHDRHRFWLGELRRATRKGGMLVLFEHNPLNPLTVAAVRSCPFDGNARLIAASKLAREMRSAGWTPVRCEYRIFFPHPLSRLRPLERFLRHVPLGAQYSLSAANGSDCTAS